MEEATIKILYDNSCEDKKLQAGWGFSCLVETSGHSVLFDTGDDRDAFFSNAEKMGVCLSSITEVVFSHKHDDHIGGAKEILESLKETVQVYVPKGFPMEKIPSYLQAEIVQKISYISENLFVVSFPAGLFMYEQCLVVQRNSGLTIVVGCAHPGVTVMVKAIKEKFKKPVSLLIGGFHLFKKREKFVDKVALELRSQGIERVAPCHCSGERISQNLRELYKENFCCVGAGTVLTVP